LKSLSLQFYR